jgi:hypothetical protein
MTKTRRLALAGNPEDGGLRRWWNGLTRAERRELATDRRRHPLGVVVRFVEPGELSDDEAYGIDFYEYLVNHEVVFEDGRTFHICSAHPDARACLLDGRIPSGFSCPRAEAACPMLAVLEVRPGWDAKLLLASHDATLGRRDE